MERVSRNFTPLYEQLLLHHIWFYLFTRMFIILEKEKKKEYLCNQYSTSYVTPLNYMYSQKRGSYGERPAQPQIWAHPRRPR